MFHLITTVQHNDNKRKDLELSKLIFFVVWLNYLVEWFNTGTHHCQVWLILRVLSHYICFEVVKYSQLSLKTTKASSTSEIKTCIGEEEWGGGDMHE